MFMMNGRKGFSRTSLKMYDERIIDKWDGEKALKFIDKLKMNEEKKKELKKAWRKGVTITAFDLKDKDTKTAPVKSEIETKAKVSSHYLNNYFTTDETLKNYQGQITFFNKFFLGNRPLTKQEAGMNLDIAIKNGYEGISTTYYEDKAIKGLFRLFDKQNASEQRPFIVLDNISQLYDEILEKKVTKKRKDGYEFRDFSGAEVKQIDEGLESLETTLRVIIIKISKKDKKGRKTYDLIMAKEPLIKILRSKENMTKEELNKLTEEGLRQTGQVKISILPIFLRDYHKYYKLLPKDISKEVREKCKDVKKVSEPLINFINFLHRHDRNALINGNEVRRNRLTLTKELKLEEQREKRGKKYINNILFKCYDIAKRTGYLTGYKIDQRGKTELVDVFYLNVLKYEHLKPRKVKEDENKRLDYVPKP